MGKRGSRKALLVASMLLGAVLLGVGLGYVRYLSYVPRYTPPTVVLPSPNARDDYLSAVQVLQQTSRLRGLKSPSATIPELRPFVADSRPALERLRKGFAHDYGTPPVTSFTAAFPELGAFRNLSRRLIAEGDLARLEGRPADAARSYLDCLHLGVDIAKGGVLIHGMTSQALLAQGLQRLSALSDELDPAAAAKALREMDRLEARSATLPEIFRAEKEGSTQALLAMFHSSGMAWTAMVRSAGARYDPLGQGLWLQVVPRSVMIRRYRDYMDRVIAASAPPYTTVAVLPPVPPDPFCQVLAGPYQRVLSVWAAGSSRWQSTKERLAARARPVRPASTTGMGAPGTQ